ncbi:hypothetical protein [Brasilonema bromeliae]|uniref:Uncharacterized protein n=1 Tax=Brasilonema bromeliae SPC951 TaxID=385972 RepID=A0ABX1P202_9CYAN|nr:hypothetical protein [Brasilonema bromeliae]NMG18351.1 hypothetical protein [Brasilonema bromeliae SPC951]
MTLTDDIEQFQTHTAKSSETLEGINELANKLFECSTDELASLLAEIESLCEQAKTEIKYTADCLVEINDSWGFEPLQHYSEKKQNTNQTTDSTVKGGNSSTQSTTVSENETKQVEAGDFAPRIEQAKELLDKAVDVCGELFNEAVKTGKNLQASLMIATSLTSGFLTKTVKLVDDVVDGISSSIEISNRVVSQPGMPLSENSSFAVIKEISDKTEEYFGVDGELAAAYEIQKDQEEKERKRKRAAQSRDESRGASSK